MKGYPSTNILSYQKRCFTGFKLAMCLLIDRRCRTIVKGSLVIFRTAAQPATMAQRQRLPIDLKTDMMRKNANMKQYRVERERKNAKNEKSLIPIASKPEPFVNIKALSVAKQSKANECQLFSLDCFVASLLAMTEKCAKLISGGIRVCGCDYGKSAAISKH